MTPARCPAGRGPCGTEQESRRVRYRRCPYFADESGLRSDFHAGTTWGKRGETPVVLIVDGHPAHRAKLVRDYVAGTNGRLTLCFLPPYSPELNPDERVWNHVKNHTVGRRIVHDAKELARMVTFAMRKLKRSPELVRSFFRAPDTRYAAA